jgi:hypothetical protein
MGWNPSYGVKTDREVVRKLAQRLFPEIEEELTSAWSQLSGQDSAACRAAADQLERRANSGKLGRAGIVGQYLFPDGLFLLKDLATCLRLHAGAADAVSVMNADHEKTAEVVTAIYEYLAPSLVMQRRSGYHIAPMRERSDWLANRPWFIDGSEYDAIRKAWKSYATRFPEAVRQTVDTLKERLRRSDFEAKIYDRMIDFLLQRSLQS